MVQVFISHASGDPDWPEAEVVILAQALAAQGVQVWLDLWKRSDAKRRLSEAEWRDWMRDALDQANHVLCLVSPLYQSRAARDNTVAGGLGVALETSVLDRQIYRAKQRVEGWIWLAHKDGTPAVSVTPDFLDGHCPEYPLPSAQDELVADLTGQGGQAPDATTGPVAAPPLPPDQPLFRQARLASERLEAAPTYWQALKQDDYDGARPPASAMISPTAFVQWLLTVQVDKTKVLDLFAALGRSLDEIAAKSPERHAAEQATVGLYCLLACRLVDVAQIKFHGQMAVELASDAPLICALVATARFGGKLQLELSGADGLPCPEHAYVVNRAPAADQPGYEFDRAVFRAVCAGTQEADEVSEGDGPLTEDQQEKLKARLRDIRQRQRKTLALIVRVCADRSPVCSFADAHQVPIFLPSEALSLPLIGISAKNLLAEIQEFWASLIHFGPNARTAT